MQVPLIEVRVFLHGVFDRLEVRCHLTKKIDGVIFDREEKNNTVDQYRMCCADD